jgi:hypothetical protein
VQLPEKQATTGLNFMDSTQSTNACLQAYGRLAGLLYLVIIVFGISSEVFIRSSLIDFDDAALTAKNIINEQGRFMLGFVFDAIMIAADIAIAILFYLVFKPVSTTLALLAAAFRLIQAAILGFNLMNYLAAYLVLSGALGTSTPDTAQLNEQALMYLELHSYGYDIALMFFAVSIILLGVMIFRTANIPAYIGAGLIVAAVVYLLGSFTHFFYEDYLSFVQPLYLLPFVVELTFCLWLLKQRS